MKIYRQDLEILDCEIMIKNFNENFEKFRDYDSELLLKILNKTYYLTKNYDDKELFVDENWKINTEKNINNKINSNNSNLKKVLSEIFPDKKILIRDNNDSSQTIFLS